MIYLWDTDICIHFLNGNEKIIQKTKAIGAANICTTIINILELKFGAYNSAKIELNLERINRLQQKLTILKNLDNNIASFFGHNKVQLKRRGITICDFDLLIAGFAYDNNAILVTNNTKHFKNIPGLKIENWLADSYS